MLATAAFTLFGVGAALLMRQSLQQDGPLRAAAPDVSLEQTRGARVEALRSGMDDGVRVATLLPRPGPVVEEELDEAAPRKPAPIDLEHAERKQLEEQLRRVLWGEGRHDEKLALLRGLAGSARADKLEWLTFAATNLPEQPTAKGESLAVSALGLIAELSEQDGAARKALERLAFETEGLHVVLRRRAAALAAERWPARESDVLRRRLRSESDRTVASAALEALDRRADEPGVREWLGDFAEWRRPVDGEP